MTKHFLIFFFTFFSSFISAENYIIVHASSFELELYSEQNTLIKSYPIGIGKQGVGKTKVGDQKTPIGEYHILWKASENWTEEGGLPIQKEKAYCGNDNSYSQVNRKGFSDEPIWGESFGGNDATFICLDYPNKLDLLKDYTGSGIGIHGSLNGGIGEFSSAGCIKMYPKDARDLYLQVDVGTTVIIKND